MAYVTMKELLEAEERQNSGLFKSILSAMRPLMGVDRAECTAFGQFVPTHTQKSE